MNKIRNAALATGAALALLLGAAACAPSAQAATACNLHVVYWYGYGPYVWYTGSYSRFIEAQHQGFTTGYYWAC
jgi:spermidine/putrescine-binding protein